MWKFSDVFEWLYSNPHRGMPGDYMKYCIPYKLSIINSVYLHCHICMKLQGLNLELIV